MRSEYSKVDIRMQRGIILCILNFLGSAHGLYANAECLNGTLNYYENGSVAQDTFISSSCLDKAKSTFVVSCINSEIVLHEVKVGVNSVGGHCYYRPGLTTCQQVLRPGDFKVTSLNNGTGLHLESFKSSLCTMPLNFAQVKYKCGADISVFSDGAVWSRHIAIKLGAFSGPDTSLSFDERTCFVQYSQGVLATISATVSVIIQGNASGIGSLRLHQTVGSSVWERFVDLTNTSKLLSWDLLDVKSAPLIVTYQGDDQPAYVVLKSDNSLRALCGSMKKKFLSAGALSASSSATSNSSNSTWAPTLPNTKAPKTTLWPNTTHNVSMNTTPTSFVNLCPPNWKMFGDKCYLSSLPKQSCRHASHACRALGGSLVVIETQQEWNVLRAWLYPQLTASTTSRPWHYRYYSRYTTYTSFYIGLFDLDSSAGKKWTWANGLPLDASNAKFAKISQKEGGACAILSNDQIKAAPAYKSQRFVCQISLQYYLQGTTNTSTLPNFQYHDISREESVLCEPGWQARPHADTCYYFSSNKKTCNFSEAEEQCRRRKSWLVNVETPEEMRWLEVQAALRNMRDSDDDSWWTGLRKHAPTQTWHWGTCTVLNDTLISWRENEPNNSGNIEHCAEFTWEGNWNDHSCSKEFEYICEKEKNFEKLVQECSGPTPAPFPTSEAEDQKECEFASSTIISTTTSTTAKTSLTTSTTSVKGQLAGVVLGVCLLLVVVGVAATFVIRRGGSPCIQKSGRRVPYSSLHDELIL